MIFYDSDESEIRLPFYSSFSTFWNIFGSLCTHVFCSKAWLKRGDVRSCAVKLKVIQNNPNVKPEIFQI